MTYPCHKLPPSPPQGSENWLRPPYHRGPMKRRSGSPSLFPRKVHISEEKVAEQLGNLSLQHSSKYVSMGVDTHRPDFLLDGTQRRKTFQEIEDSIEIDANDELQHNSIGTVELAPELANEIKKMSRKILTAGSYRLSAKRIPTNPCQEVVLWKPPSGSIIQVLNAVREAALSEEDEDDYYSRNCGPRLDKIEEEVNNEVEDSLMTDEMDVNSHTMPTNHQFPNESKYLINSSFLSNAESATERALEDSLMDLCTDLT